MIKKFLTKPRNLSFFLLLLCFSQGSLFSLSLDLSNSYQEYFRSNETLETLTANSIFLQHSYAVEGWLNTAEEMPASLLLGLGYAFVNPTQISSLEFSRGFQTIFGGAGVSFQVNDLLNLAGGVKFNNSWYTGTSIIFAHISCFLRPELKLSGLFDEISFIHRMKIFMPIEYDLRKDIELTGSIGIGASLSIPIVEKQL